MAYCDCVSHSCLLPPSGAFLSGVLLPSRSKTLQPQHGFKIFDLDAPSTVSKALKSKSPAFEQLTTCPSRRGLTCAGDSSDLKAPDQASGPRLDDLLKTSTGRHLKTSTGRRADRGELSVAVQRWREA
ncbi:hypothetical protein DFH06DRAFT_1329727 [Mycena polygramma]|nr:hypothetical protein DFH06DRAFT_1329727 [Mycena polygramma]